MTEPHFPTPKNPWIIGILNVTPDSFSDGGDFIEEEAAFVHGLEMTAEGAHCIDIGGESTRPGAAPVDAETEWSRIGPVLSRLTKRGVRVSVDTTKAEVARRALEHGAWMVNDVDGLRDPDMLETVGMARCHVCIMHRQGSPSTMQQAPTYGNVTQEVADFLSHQAAKAEEYGVPRDRICLDPGFGFGKTLTHNVQLLLELPTLVELGYPILVGLSRKSMVGRLVGTPTDPVPESERIEGSLALAIAALERGASIIRVHDVCVHARGIRAWTGLFSHQSTPG